LPLLSCGTRGSLMSSHAKMVGSSRYATPVTLFTRVTSAVKKSRYSARQAGEEKKSAQRTHRQPQGAASAHMGCSQAAARAFFVRQPLAGVACPGHVLCDAT
jgi:hypothetical protein